MLVTVIAPCRNEKNDVRGFLDSVLQQELEPGLALEVLVADGQSDDGTRDVLESYARCSQGVRVVDNPGRIVSTGLNAALLQARGEIIVRMDVHTTYAPDYIRECVRSLRESRADNVGGPWVAKGRGRWGEAIAVAFQCPLCCGGGRAHDPDFEGEVDTVYLGCWNRSIFNKIGLFDPGLVRNQDDEFNFRLLRSGGRIWQSPKIKSTYVARSSPRALFRQYLQYGYWKVAVIRKHRDLASIRHIVPSLFVISLLAAAFAALGSLALGLTTTANFIGLGLLTELSIYAVAVVAASLWCKRLTTLATTLLLPAVFTIYHVGYGLGFLMALLSCATPEQPGRRSRSLFTAITR